MKCIETFKTREKASEKQRLLAEKGIKSRVLVDPLESIAPALSAFHGVSLVVEAESREKATRILKDALSRAA